MKLHPIIETDSCEYQLMGSVKAGFPSTTEDVCEKLDLVKFLVRRFASTIVFQADGTIMVDAAPAHLASMDTLNRNSPLFSSLLSTE